MAIASKRMDSRVPEPLKLVEEIAEPRRSTFTALVPENRIDELLKYVEGKPWTCTYYGQLLNTASTVNFFDIKAGNLSQSYVEIRQLLLQVQSELSYTYNEDDGNSSLNGSAIVPFKVTPQVGDLFLANIDTGEDALFLISSVNRKTHRKRTLYEIEYSLLVYVNDHKDYMINLNKRINESYFFNNYYDTRNKNYLITTTEKENIDKLRLFQYQSLAYFFKTFIQPTKHTLGVPGLRELAIDPLLSNFIFSTVDTTKYGIFEDYRFAIESIGYRRETILDCLKNKRMPSSNTEFRAAFYKSAQYFRSTKIFSPQFSLVDCILFIDDPDDNMVSQLPPERRKYAPTVDVRNSKNYNMNEEIFLPFEDPEKNPWNKPILNGLFEDNYYIVSKHFYDYLEDNSKYEEISFIELTIARYLKGDVLASSDLIKICHRWEEWSLLHQMYMLPIVWYLIKVTLGRI